MEFLLIDDDLGYCQSLVLFGKINGININFRHNHTDGFAELEKNTNYQALILDVKCLIDSSQAIPHESAFGLALEMLTNFEKRTERFLPFAVCTGYDELMPTFKPQIEYRKAKIYHKGSMNHQIEMLAYLKIQVENSQNFQLERQYADVFEIFEKGYLEQDVKSNLLNILKNMNSVEIAEIRKNLALIRSTRETIIQVLGNHNRNFSQPELISKFSDLVNKVASNYGSHKPRINDISPSKYSVISLAFALLEMLLWFKSEKEK